MTRYGREELIITVIRSSHYMGSIIIFPEAKYRLFKHLYTNKTRGTPKFCLKHE